MGRMHVTVPPRMRAAAAAISCALLVAAGFAGSGSTASAATTAAADAAMTSVTVHVDPSYQQQAFEGWGTSLVWMANATGGYPDEIRKKLVDLVFGADGLNLNIARYNIGGGNAPDVRGDYMKTGATMDGFWKAPSGTTHTDKEWWDPANPDHWNWDADANQRWWVDQIKSRVDRWEAFSNSPPYFQTVSGYVSGGFDGSAEQIRADRVDQFATYLVRVAEHLEQAHGIRFDSIDPLNEPNTSYWKTTLGTDGQPTGGRQEGAHAGPALQAQVIAALRRALNTSTTHAVVSAPDETNPTTFVKDVAGWDTTALAAVPQLNVHTYGTSQRTSARDIAKGTGKKLWMSEVEGSYLSGGTSYTSMVPGLGMAGQIINDFRELEPAAWVLWQPIEDAGPQQAGGGNWGSIHVPFGCTATDTLATCPIQTNTKFNTIRNFTHYIRPGDHVVAVDDTASLAAVQASGKGAVVVHVNAGTTAQQVTLDLSRFAKANKKATVTPVVTTADGALVQGEAVPVVKKSATLVVPAQSVTTFLINKVSGVAADAALVQPGHVYRLKGVASSRSLAPSSSTGVVIRTAATAAEQLWTLRKLTTGQSNRERYALVTGAGGKRLAVRSGATVLEDDSATVDDPAQWVLSTTDDGSWTLVNAATGRLLEVTSAATADGSAVGTYTPTSGTNQRWTIVDETVLRTETAHAYTVPGRVPELPQTVTPVYRDSARGALPVTWTMPASRWKTPGTKKVKGVATDPLGRTVPAVVSVVIDTFTRSLPAEARTYVGGSPDLPTTVVGVGTHGGLADLPVTWNDPPAGTFGQAGTAWVEGVAHLVDGSTVPAVARVEVTEPVEVNAALDATATVAATYTESGYSAEGLRNGVRTDKAWSNWKSGTKNASDTITFTLPKSRDLTRVVTYFYADGSNSSWPASIKVQVQAADGSWVDASGAVAVSGAATPVDVAVAPATAVGRVSAVRVVMTARTSGYITASEIAVYAKAAAA